MKCIVVVDDNDGMRSLLRASLAADGYEVVTAGNGREALDRMRDRVPDLVLMDLQMPVLDGLGALQAMRAQPLLKAVPTVAITAFSYPHGREQALAAGFSGYLTKPVKREALLAEVRRWLH